MKLDAAQRSAMDQFDRQSDRYGRGHVLAETGDLEAAVRGEDFPVEGAALDVATGGGHTALWLTRRGLTVTATDVSARMLENCAALLAGEGLACAVRQGAAEELPDLDATFVVVTCRVAAHHFSDPAAFVREAARVLVPGGYLLVIDGTVPDDDPVAVGWTHAVEKLRDPSHGRLIPPAEWRRMSEDAGLEVLRCEVGQLKQPDLEWYFATADTSEENRVAVRRLVAEAPPEAVRAFEIGVEADGRVIWQWQRVSLLCRKRTEA